MSDFTIVSWTLVAIIIGLLFLPLLFDRESDVAPLSLLHQSYISPTRRQNESAIYRSRETPHGYPLRTGLGIRQGYGTRNGDLRDIWNLFVQNKGKLVSILGLDKVEHAPAALEKDLDAVGGYIQSLPSTGRKVVAVYLPNCVENIISGFICAYYDFTYVTIPYPSPTETIEAIMQSTGAHVLINGAGTVDLTDFKNVSFTQAILVVEEGSRHMDFSSMPGEAMTVVQWHDLNAPGMRPAEIDEAQPAMAFSMKDVKSEKDVIVSYTHRNIVSAVAAQMTAVPPLDRLRPEDTFLPANSLSDQYTRVMTYAALASGCTVALNSVAGQDADLEAACQHAQPTVIVASPDSLYDTNKLYVQQSEGAFNTFNNYMNSRALQNGRMPKSFQGSSISSKLRLVYTAENLSAGTKALSSKTLNSLRVFLTAKIIYAFTFPTAVAGAVTQQNIHDYRFDRDAKGLNVAHFGAPLASLEVKLRDSDQFKATDENPRGEIVVKGPAVLGDVIGGERDLGVIGKWRSDGCLELVVGK